MLVGLGDQTEITAVEVLWPDGSSEKWTDLPINQYSTIRQGTGTPGEANSNHGKTKGQ